MSRLFPLIVVLLTTLAGCIEQPPSATPAAGPQGGSASGSAGPAWIELSLAGKEGTLVDAFSGIQGPDGTLAVAILESPNGTLSLLHDAAGDVRREPIGTLPGRTQQEAIYLLSDPTGQHSLFVYVELIDTLLDLPDPSLSPFVASGFRLEYWFREGATWRAEVVDESPLGALRLIVGGAAIGPAGAPVIIANGRGGDQAAYVYERVAAGWSATRLADATGQPDIAASEDGALHACVPDLSTGIHYLRRPPGGAWEDAIVMPTPADPVICDIAVGRSGSPHLLFDLSDQRVATEALLAPTRTLAYATRANGAWTVGQLPVSLDDDVPRRALALNGREQPFAAVNLAASAILLAGLGGGWEDVSPPGFREVVGTVALADGVERPSAVAEEGQLRLWIWR